MSVAFHPADLLACQECHAFDVDLTQVCGSCGRSLCASCWGPWRSLACRRCRDQAKWRHPAGRHLRVVR